MASNKQPTEYLDEDTGATVTVVREPLVFAHEGSGSGRDYVTLAAAWVDRSGRLSYVLIGYIWSVGWPVSPKESQRAAEELVLQADDQQIELTRQDLSPHELGIGVPVHRPPVGAAKPYVYVTDLATVRLLAESSHLSLHVQDRTAAANYRLFQDGRGALKEFVRFATIRF